VDTLAFVRPEHGTPPATGDDFVERLVNTLRATHGLADDTLATRLELALATFDEASIFTIHGFCQRALADTPFTAQMPLALELVQHASPWIAQAATAFWRRRVDTDDLDPALADLLVERKDSPDYFAKLLKRHLTKPLARTEWPEGIDADIRPDEGALAEAHATARK